jgi:hypothetical protein
VNRTVVPSVSGPHMIESPIIQRAAVSPTCRGSTGRVHNGWNPTSPSAALSGGLAAGLRDGWLAQPQPGSAGGSHAVHRLRDKLQRPRSSWPGWGLRDRHSRGGRWTPDQAFSGRSGSLGLFQPGVGGFGRLEWRGLQPAPSPRLAGSIGGCRPRAILGLRAHVRSRLEGGFASGNRSVPHAAGRRAFPGVGLVLVHRGRGGAESSDARGRHACRLAGLDLAASGRGTVGLCPVRSRFNHFGGRSGRRGGARGTFIAYPACDGADRSSRRPIPAHESPVGGPRP